MKTSTKWIVGSISGVLALILLFCGGLGFVFFGNNGVTGYEKRQAEIKALSQELLGDFDQELIEEGNNTQPCALSFVDDISNQQDGRRALSSFDLKFDESKDARDAFDSIVNNLESASFESTRKAGKKYYSDGASFSGENKDSDIKVGLSLDDYLGSDNAYAAIVNLTLTSNSCYKD